MMKQTGFDIKNREFKTSFRGYDPDEVDHFLDDLGNEWDEVQKQNTELRQKLAELETQVKDYKAMEKALERTFLQAQETTGKSIENARKEAQLLIQEAEMKGVQIVEKSRHELTALKEQVTILKAKKDTIVSRLKMLLTSELDLIKSLEVDEELGTRDREEVHQEISKEKTEIEEIIKSLDQ